MQAITLIFPHQLVHEHPILDLKRKIILAEEYLFFRQFQFHKQKLIFHRAGMKAYAKFLTGKGFKVEYIDSNQLLSRTDLFKLLSSMEVNEIHLMDTVDDWLEKDIQNAQNSYDIKFKRYDHPMFLLKKSDLKKYQKEYENKKITQHIFYVHQRKRLKILVDKQENPIGNRWSYDWDNRKPIPKDLELPQINYYENDFITEAREYVENYFPNNPGVNANLIVPVTREEALIHLNTFIKETLINFGTYEDAIDQNHPVLFHSLLSPLLNVGLLLPMEVIKSVLEAYEKNTLPINSVEGFIRQVIGWREFMRVMYVLRGSNIRKNNYFDQHKELSNEFYQAKTKILPVDDSIKKVLKYGYTHHIERLMILGNFMLLSEYHPDSVYKWFMEMFIDAYDWVMVPNVYGMSQFADGGSFTSKPYISGSRYITMMGKYPKGAWAQVWDARFWIFIDKHQQKLKSNPRISLLVKQLQNKNIDSLKKLSESVVV